MILGMSKQRKWITLGVAAVCFVIGLILSWRIEPGVHVQTVTLGGDTPAIQFLPAGTGPHPVALLAHGFTGAKENLFLYGEALAASGFTCFAPDLPGHGTSPRTFTIMDTVHALEALDREVGPVDVFVGHSMGGFAGGEAVREGGIRPKLFIAIGSMPVLGDHAPPLLFLSGRFDEVFPPALLKSRTDAHWVISPWANHGLEAFSPMLMNAAVQAACATARKTPSPPPSAWIWRLLGDVLAILAAGKLASCLADLFPQLGRFRGLFMGAFLIATFMLTVSGRWIDAVPHPRFFLKQGTTTVIILLLAIVAGRRRIPRWSFAALAILLGLIVVWCLKAAGGIVLTQFAIFTFAQAVIVGTVISYITTRRGSRLQGDVAMAIITGYAVFQWNEFPRQAPVTSKPHVAIKLNSTNCDSFVGQYLFSPDMRFPTGVKLTLRREGDQLVAQGQTPTQVGDAVKIYPESETNFFLTPRNARELIFVKNAKGVITTAIVHDPGMPDSEGKKVSDPAK